MARTQKKQSDQVNIEVLSYAEQVENEFMSLYMQYDVANAPEKRKNEIIDSFWSDIYKAVFKPDKPQINQCNSKLQPWNIKELNEVLELYINLCKRFGGVIKYYQFCKLVGYNRYTIDLWHKANINNRTIFLLNDADIEEEYKVNGSIYILYNNNTDNMKRIYKNDISSVYVIDDIKKDINNIYNNSITITDILNNSDYIKGFNNYNIVNNNMLNNTDNSNINNIDIDKLRDKLSRTRLDVKKKLNAEMQDSNTNQLSNDTMGAAIRANNEEELGKLYEPKRMIQAEQVKQIASAGQLPRFELTEKHTQFITKNE